MLLCVGLGYATALGAAGYWDGNDTAPGAGATPTGTWGANPFWSPDSNGVSPPVAWTSGDTAVFSAGTDAVNPFTVTVNGVQTVGGIEFEEGTVTLSGGIIVLTFGATLSLTPASATINSLVSGSTLTKTGSGTLFLNGANIYTGYTTVAAGVIAVGNNVALGSASAFTTVNSSAAVHFAGDRTLTEPFIINGTGISGSGALRNISGSNTISGSIKLESDARINADAGTLVLAAGVGATENNRQLTIGGAGDTIMAGDSLAGKSSLLTKDGDGVLTVTAYCNHRAGTIVNGGTLRLGASDVLHGAGFVAPLVLNGTFDLNGFNETFDSLTGSGLVTNGGTLTLGSSSNAPVFAGVISGPTALVKTDINTQTLTGVSTYSGTTTVSNGVLMANGSLAGGGAVSVEPGATLGGTGTIAGPVTVAAGGGISPGNTAGTLTLAGGLNLSAGGACVWELATNSTNHPGTNFDQIVVTGGNLTLWGASTLNIRFIGTATAPDSSDPFWQSPRSWKIVSISGGMNPDNSNFSIIEVGSYVAGDFSTSVDADGGIRLNFRPPRPVTNTVDFATVTSRPFLTGVRGHNPYRSMNEAGFTSTFSMSSPSLMRGIAGGLDADTYDWRVYNSGSKWGATAWGTLVTTLDFLRKCRDTGSQPLFTANMFGGGYTNEYGTWICQYDNHTNLYNPGGYGTNAVTGTAAQLAADWVRYCNIIVPTYQQGQESLIGNDPNFNALDNQENLRVYHSVALGGEWDGRDILLTNGEAAVTKVIWWEVGNEPEVDLGLDSTLVNQHVIADKIVFRDRYRTIANAMRAVDSTLLIGPCLTAGNNNEWLGRVAEDTNAPLDFVGIHPYYNSIKTSWPDPIQMTTALMNIGQFVAGRCIATAATLSNYAGATRFGTKPAGWQWTTPLIASEYNPVNWDATSVVKRSTASGLGLLEHCFRFAHPNRTTNALPSWFGANYWENPSRVVFLTNAFEALRDFVGDRILENPSPSPQPVPDFAPLSWPLRVYITQQTNGANRVHVWGLNFSEAQDQSVSLALTNLPFTVRQVLQRSFGRPGAENSLTNSTGLGWIAQDVTASVNPSIFTFTVENAGFAILTFQEVAVTNWYWDTSKSSGLQGGNGIWSTNPLVSVWSTRTNGDRPVFAWADGREAVFDTTLSAGGTVTVTGTVSPHEVIVDKANCDFAGTGTIDLGPGGMTINAPTSIANGAGNPTLAGRGGVTVNPGDGNTVTFDCTNTYSGETVIATGIFTLGARGGVPNSARIVLSNATTFNVAAKTSDFILEAGQTLAGDGSAVGSITANGTVSPGAPVGTLTFSTNLTLAGTTCMDVSRDGPAVTNDFIVCSNLLTHGGTLVVTNRGPDPLAAGDTFTLFSALTYNGSFNRVELPTVGFGLDWDTNGLGTGVLQVVGIPVFSSAALSGTNVVLSGANGEAGAPYFLVASTNVTLPMSNWTRVLSNSFGSDGSFSAELPLEPADPMRVFRLQYGN